jgi:hypothetical protein
MKPRASHPAAEAEASCRSKALPRLTSAHSAGPAGGQLSALARASRRFVYRFIKSRSPRLHEQCVEGKVQKKKTIGW